MFKYDFGELGVRPMRVNHKLSPSQGWDGKPCLAAPCLPPLEQLTGSTHTTPHFPSPYHISNHKDPSVMF